MIFQISKHIKDLLQMSLAWQLQMRVHHWHFTGDINASKLYNKLEDANQRMVVGCIFCIQIPSNTNLWLITTRYWSGSLGNQILDSLFQVINNIVNCILNLLLGAKSPRLRSVFKYYYPKLSANILSRTYNRLFLEEKILPNFILYHRLSSITDNEAVVNIE